MENPYFVGREVLIYTSTMLKTNLTLLLLLALNVTLKAQTTEDEKAIIQVIEQETRDFTQMPFSEVAKKHWILDAKTFILVNDKEREPKMLRQEDMLANNELAPQEKMTVLKENYIITVVGDMANVYCQQTVTHHEYNSVQNSHEVRSMQKVNGVWKLHNLTVLNY